MDADLLKRRYSIEPIDLPDPHGVNVAEIECLDSEEYDGIENGRRVPMVRHKLYLKGWKLPLKLNNTRVDVLTGLLGRDTTRWTGRKIGLIAASVQKYGKTVLDVVIDVRGVDHLSTTPTLAAPGGGQQPVNLIPIGVDKAALVVSELRCRGKSWDDFVAYMNQNDKGSLVAGKEPPDVGGTALDWARKFCGMFPRVKPPLPAGELEAIKKSWRPAPEVVNPQTGEVIRPAAHAPQLDPTAGLPRGGVSVPPSAQEPGRTFEPDPSAEYEPIREEDIPF